MLALCCWRCGAWAAVLITNVPAVLAIRGCVWRGSIKAGTRPSTRRAQRRLVVEFGLGCEQEYIVWPSSRPRWRDETPKETKAGAFEVDHEFWIAVSFTSIMWYR